MSEQSRAIASQLIVSALLQALDEQGVIDSVAVVESALNGVKKMQEANLPVPPGLADDVEKELNAALTLLQLQRERRQRQS
jgi:hypothetical protein